MGLRLLAASRPGVNARPVTGDSCQRPPAIPGACAGQPSPAGQRHPPPARPPRRGPATAYPEPRGVLFGSDTPGAGRVVACGDIAPVGLAQRFIRLHPGPWSQLGLCEASKSCLLHQRCIRCQGGADEGSGAGQTGWDNGVSARVERGGRGHLLMQQAARQVKSRTFRRRQKNPARQCCQSVPTTALCVAGNLFPDGARRMCILSAACGLRCPGLQ